jgi:hypothetical protein
MDTPTIGEKFRTEFQKLQKAPEPEKQEPDKTVEPNKQEPARVEPVKPEKPAKVEPEKPEKVEKPKSPLEAAIEPKVPHGTEDDWEKEEVLKEFSAEKPDWRNARRVMGTQSKTVKQQKAEIEKLTTQLTTTVNPVEIENLKKEREELSQKLAEREEAIKAINAEYSDDYRALMKERDGAVSKVLLRFQAYGNSDKADMLKEALQLPAGRMRNAAIKETLAELEPDDKARVLTMIEGVEAVDDKVAEFKKDLPAKWDEMVRKKEEIRQQEDVKAVKTLEVNFAKIADTLPESSPLLREINPEIDGADSWNADIRKAREEGLRVLKPGATLEESVETVIKGKRFDAVQTMLLETRKELSEANKRLAEFDSGGPDFKGGKKPEVKKAQTHGEKYREAYSTMQSGGTE